MTGTWSFWFSNGQLAASGRYQEDRKIGAWSYFDEEGLAMEYGPWEVKFSHWDWAFDDYSGMPRGENWPLPPGDCEPLSD
jgi:antitoxin component YwqK of YwqJK toxin-antitoxin module